MNLLITVIILLSFQFAFCQQTTTIVYDGKGNIIRGSFIKTVPPNPVTLKDSVSNYTFVLDSSHIYVTAYDSSGNQIWKTDPYLDNHIPVYRTNRPIIVDIRLGKSINNDPKKIYSFVWIRYSNTQFGKLDFKTGKYWWGGQD